MARYLGNKNEKEVHDLENEKVGCKISQIKPEHKIPIATLEEAKKYFARGWDGCKWCLPQYHRK